jgi:hypothetical protein
MNPRAFEQPQLLGKILPGDVLRKSLSLNILHAIERAAVRQRAGIMHGNNPRMFETSQNTRFPEKQCSEIVCRRYEIEHLERYPAIQHHVVRQPHAAHASTSKVAHDTVTCSGQIGHLHLSLELGDDPIRKLLHLTSTPSSACASRRNSWSVAVISRS